MRLVEIDLLHETSPIFSRIPDYSKKAPGAKPYHIMVSDPRPSLEKGTTQIYSVDVSQPLPTVNIPLAGQDTIQLNFNAIYQASIANRRAFTLMIDTTQPPERFKTYSASDQKFIQQQMQTPE